MGAVPSICHKELVLRSPALATGTSGSKDTALGKGESSAISHMLEAFSPLSVETTILRLENLLGVHLFLVRVKVLPRSCRDCQ